MKKHILRILLVTALSVGTIGVAPAQAAQASAPKTLVTGIVIENGKPAVGAYVSVKCAKYYSNTDYADETGAYLVEFPRHECGWGSFISVRAASATGDHWQNSQIQKMTNKLNMAYVVMPLTSYR